MTKDLQTIAVQDELQVLFLDYVQGMPTPTLLVRGTDFSSVSEVLVNGARAPEYAVLSRGEMMVEIPSSEVGAPIESVQVLSNRFTATERSLIRFRVSTQNRGISGIEKLVQLFIRTFFTTPGRNIFDKQDGGGARSLVGTVTGEHARTQVTGGFARAVDRAAAQIIAAQSTVPRLPSDEKLAAADLVAVDYSTATGRVSGRVKLTSASGKTALANVSEQD